MRLGPGHLVLDRACHLVRNVQIELTDRVVLGDDLSDGWAIGKTEKKHRYCETMKQNGNEDGGRTGTELGVMRKKRDAGGR